MANGNMCQYLKDSELSKNTFLLCKFKIVWNEEPSAMYNNKMKGK